ncbi:PREDICTED: olfactory receptor 6B1-like [Nanorana parkeri]|uniref:olfactory receptor 6B1-like n=1 Tax=Nanorana parkeri TaxID=125878 RepID=UPI0008548726|nr:PREDICTED: olfactory receptor 6B1-like [Nanorana parkeri]
MTMPENVENNQTQVTEFLLLGLGDLKNFRILLFIVFLILHIMGLTSNILVLILVAFHRVLHFPMYFFLSQLSLCELLFISEIVPNILWLTLAGSGKVSVFRCIFHFFLLSVQTITQCLLLASMSFDRYVAICRPLHYTVIMTFPNQLQMVIFPWLLGLALSVMLYVFINKLSFCDLNVINNFSCDIPELIQVSCSDTYFIDLITSVTSFVVFVLPLMFIIATYIFILRAILKIPTTTGKQKAFSTCSSHLMVVSMYYGTLCSVYLAPSGESSVTANKSLTLLYTLLTPLFNPLVYSLRNQEIRTVIFNCQILYIRDRNVSEEAEAVTE